MNKYDTLEIGDLVTSDFLKNVGDVNSIALEILYRAVPRTDLVSTDPGVENDGAGDTSEVFEINARNT